MVCPVYEDLRFGLVTEAMLVNPDFEGAKEKFLKPHVKLQSQKICLSNIFQTKSLPASVFSQNPCKDFVVYV